ncbi:MAG: hypothetical protein EOO17_02210 [Chloroflexi bacterium]|nr:MAG: hypothetical protein EOO17_02210 [Chloroflexota bacterium]
MYDDKRVDIESSSNNASTPSPKSYSILMKLSKGMGGIATRSYVEVKNLLKKEITVVPADRFLDGLVGLRRRSGSTGEVKGSDAQNLPESSDDKPPVSAGDMTYANAEHGKQQEAAKGNTQVDASNNLKKAVQQAHEVLARANTVFPVTLFPDTVLVDRTKVTIIRRNFFWSEDVMSIRIEDVLNVSASVGPLFGSLTIASRVMSTTDHFQINHFWREDASHLKHIIQGYVIAQHNNIDTAHLSKTELIETLQELGHDSGK